MTRCTAIETSARLAIIEQSGIAVVTLIEGLERDELLRSRLTRAEVLRHLRMLAGSVAELDLSIRRAMPELDWSGWHLMYKQLALRPGDALDDALWVACEALVPATLLWLRVHRKSQPALFQMTL
jgi:uncharacterized protein with HEPN domain